MRSITLNNERRSADTSRSSERRRSMASTRPFVGQDRKVREQPVELFELGGPLAVLRRRHLQRQVARGLRGAWPGVGEDGGKRADQVFQRLATLTPTDLGFQDVDAGLREATDIRHLGLELETFGVHHPEVLE